MTSSKIELPREARFRDVAGPAKLLTLFDRDQRVKLTSKRYEKSMNRLLNFSMIGVLCGLVLYSTVVFFVVQSGAIVPVPGYEVTLCMSLVVAAVMGAWGGATIECLT